jgi:chemotaxis protein CheX
MSIDEHILTQLDTTESQLLSLLNGDVVEIFSTMVGMEISLCSTLSAADSRFKNCVSAMICLSGRYNGVVSIHAPAQAAMGITSQMLGMEIGAVDADVTDAMGEIANMVGGSFKHHFVNNGNEVRLTPPTVVASNEHFRAPDRLRDTLALLFEAGSGHILVTVHLELWD